MAKHNLEGEPEEGYELVQVLSEEKGKGPSPSVVGMKRSTWIIDQVKPVIAEWRRRFPEAEGLDTVCHMTNKVQTFASKCSC